ncbi:MAG: prephenate dehydrogenase/arogenate dehydrogenase family protein, partial [Oscillospiraceae bacterium]|nr:prephenate dehydrogenase/arogenate dehydrogenase family protein [Oscillospiraceae bacterium]
MHIAIAGLGLIGGSAAKAAISRTRHRVSGYDRDAETVRRALDAGVIEDAGLAPFADADIILVALYPGASLEFLRDNA